MRAVCVPRRERPPSPPRKAPVPAAKGPRPRRHPVSPSPPPSPPTTPPLSPPQKAPVPAHPPSPHTLRFRRKRPQVPAAKGPRGRPRTPPVPGATPVPVPSVTPVTSAGAQHARKHRRRRTEKRSAAQKLRGKAAQTP